MRISDWSSDVCSSDLLEARSVDRLRFERRLGAVRFRFWIKLRNEKGDFALDLQGRDGRGMVAEPIAGRVRSEEHTSELQSLMSISYAVFCLKKKNIVKTNLRLISIYVITHQK